MNILADIAEYLETSGLGTRGVNIFIDTMPSDKSQGILLRVVVPGEWDQYFCGQLRTLSFQGVVRAATHSAGHDLAIQLNEALVLQQLQTTNALIYECYPRHEPLPTGREVSGLETFVMNFDGMYRML